MRLANATIIYLVTSNLFTLKGYFPQLRLTEQFNLWDLAHWHYALIICQYGAPGS